MSDLNEFEDAGVVGLGIEQEVQSVMDVIHGDQNDPPQLPDAKRPIIF